MAYKDSTKIGTKSFQELAEKFIAQFEYTLGELHNKKFTFADVRNQKCVNEGP